MAPSAIATLQTPEAGNARRRAPIRLRFQQSECNTKCKLSIEVNVQTIEEDGRLVREGHVLIHEGGDLRTQHLRLDCKLLHAMPYTVKELEMPRNRTDPVSLIANLPPLELGAAFPGTRGIIGRRIELIGEDGSVVGEGILGWGP